MTTATEAMNVTANTWPWPWDDPSAPVPAPQPEAVPEPWHVAQGTAHHSWDCLAAGPLPPTPVDCAACQPYLDALTIASWDPQRG